MNSYYNITQGWEATYLPNKAEYNTEVTIAPPEPLRPKDVITLQKDFYDSRTRVEYPDGWEPQNLVGPYGSTQERVYGTAFCEWQFEFDGYTDMKNIVLTWETKALDANAAVAVPRQTEHFSELRQSELVMLNNIRSVEVYVGKNDQIINTDMTDIMCIKNYIRSLPLTYTESQIVGKLGLMNAQVLPPARFSNVKDNKYGGENEISFEVWNEHMEGLYNDLTSNDITEADRNKNRFINSCPLYLLCPFFNQQHTYLPKGFPINIKIAFEISNERRLTAEYSNEQAFQIPRYYSIGQLDPNGYCNFVLDTERRPTITYLYSRLTTDEEFKSQMVIDPPKYNFFSYQRKIFPQAQLPNDEYQQALKAYFINMMQPFSARPLEIMMFIAPDISNLYITNETKELGQEFKRVLFSNAPFMFKSFLMEENGAEIQSIEETKYLKDSFVPGTDQSWTLDGGSGAYKWMELMDKQVNNSDTMRQENTSGTWPGYNPLHNSALILTTAPGNKFTRFLQPTQNGEAQYYLSISYYMSGSFSYQNICMTNILFKYKTQLIIDSDFNTTLVDLPAINVN